MEEGRRCVREEETLYDDCCVSDAATVLHRDRCAVRSVHHWMLDNDEHTLIAWVWLLLVEPAHMEVTMRLSMMAYMTSKHDRCEERRI